MAINTNEEEFGVDAPEPIDAESVANGGFDKLEEGQGAKTAAHKRPAHASGGSSRADGAVHSRPSNPDQGGELPISKRTLAVVVVAALVAIAVIVVLFIRVLDAPARVAPQQPEVEEIAVNVDQSITSRGSTYSLEQKGKEYHLMAVREASDGQAVDLGKIDGTPAGFVLFDGSIVIPQNLANNKWNVASFVIGSGWGQMMDREGKAVGGDGSVSEARLEGSNLVVTANGERVTVPLTW